MMMQIANVGIRQDTEGRYCLNDLHRAAGGEERHSPNRWTRTEGYKSLISEITPEMAFSPVESKQQVGTFVCKELVYAYAMWISPAFHLKVIRTFDAVVTNQLPMNPAQMSRLQLIQIAMQAEEERLALEHKVDELKPRAAIADRLDVAEGRLCIRDAAKALKLQQNKLVNWLLINKWLYRDMKGKLRGYADKTPKYIEHKITPIPTDDDAEKVSLQPMVTPSGLTRLADIFNVELEVYGEELREAA